MTPRVAASQSGAATGPGNHGAVTAKKAAGGSWTLGVALAACSGPVAVRKGSKSGCTQERGIAAAGFPAAHTPWDLGATPEWLRGIFSVFFLSLLFPVFFFFAS